MKKILVVNVNWLGDVIFSSPVFTALKTAYPRSKISCLAAPRVREVLESIPGVDEIIVYDEEGAHRSPFAKLRLIRELSQKKFDVVFLLHRALTRALFVFLAGIPRRIGYDTKSRGAFLTCRIKTPDERKTHRLDYYLNVVESFGVAVTDRASLLMVDVRVENKMRDTLRGYGVGEKDFLIVIHPGGNWDLKRWPARHFSLLIEQLMKEGKCKVVISGSRQDMALVETIISGSSHKPVVLAGKIDLKELMALMKRANCVVSADSGPLHIASSVGSAAVGIFGPTRPELTGPRGGGRSVILQHDVGCNRRPCYHLKCPDNTCMQAVNVDEVIDAIRKIQNQ
jgi:lipopolysaccharide heptosyltransferase II